MIRSIKRKRTLGLVGLLLLLLTAGAVAYFTAGGSGSGSANVGTSSTLTLHGTTAPGSNLYPGTSVTVSLSADNPSSGHQQVGTVHLSGIKACSGASSTWDPSANSGAGGCTNSGTEASTCEDIDNGSNPNAHASDFYMADVAENQDLASGSGIALSNSGTLQMNNLSTSQDQCKNVHLYLELTS